MLKLYDRYIEERDFYQAKLTPCILSPTLSKDVKFSGTDATDLAFKNGNCFFCKLSKKTKKVGTYRCGKGEDNHIDPKVNMERTAFLKSFSMSPSEAEANRLGEFLDRFVTKNILGSKPMAIPVGAIVMVCDERIIYPGENLENQFREPKTVRFKFTEGTTDKKFNVEMLYGNTPTNTPKIEQTLIKFQEIAKKYLEEDEKLYITKLVAPPKPTDKITLNNFFNGLSTISSVSLQPIYLKTVTDNVAPFLTDSFNFNDNVRIGGVVCWSTYLSMRCQGYSAYRDLTDMKIEIYQDMTKGYPYFARRKLMERASQKRPEFQDESKKPNQCSKMAKGFEKDRTENWDNTVKYIIG